jgi:hypothetical protein
VIRKTLFAGLLALISGPSLAQTPTAELLKPPADAQHFVIQSTGGKHGDSYIWTAPDGTRLGRESLGLRGQVFEMDSTGKQGKDGMPVSVQIRGVTPQGDAGETFAITGGQASWKSQVDAGKAAYSAPAFYSTLNGPIDQTAWLLERLLASPNHTMNLLPGGKARAEKLTTLEVGSGAGRKTVTAWAVHGVSSAPIPVWADANNRFFGLSFFLSWLPEAYASEHQRLTEAQSAALAAQAPALARTLVKDPEGMVAFTHVRTFDADAKRFMPERTVIVDKGLIVAEGPAGEIKVPAGAKTFDGRGKTLLPGLWDSHMHTASDYTGLQELSMGVTSVRDPGNDDTQTLDRRKRAAAGQLLAPNVYASSLIDGKGPFTAQVANAAASEAEAVAFVARAKDKGFTGVKFYGTLNKAWLPAAAAEARRLGLHVHGHIPVGMRPLEAINAGYDEITHINWIAMQAMPDSVIAVSNGIMRFEGPGRFF